MLKSSRGISILSGKSSEDLHPNEEPTVIEPVELENPVFVDPDEDLDDGGILFFLQILVCIFTDTIR